MRKNLAFIMDLDGTLLDTRSELTMIHNQCLRRFGFPEYTPEKMATFMGGSALDMIRLACPQGTSECIIQQYYNTYLELYYCKCLNNTKPYDGITEFLHHCVEKEIQVAVLTNKTEKIACKMIEHFFPDIPFRFTWGNNNIRPLKPAPDAGALAELKFGLPSNRIVYVGDSEGDMQFARNCGMIALAACWGYRSRSALKAAGADYLLERPSELLTMIHL